MGTAEDLVLAEPLGVDGSEQAERHHRVLAVEDVVDQALKVEGVVAVRHDVRRVGRRQPERVRELVRLVGKRRHLCPAKKKQHTNKEKPISRWVAKKRMLSINHGGPFGDTSCSRAL